MNQEELFGSLVENALEFLDRTLADLDYAPKYALISFVTAVELVFKARLWLLDPMWVAEEPTAGTIEKFSEGKSKTVGLDLARRRIEALCDDRLDKIALSAFERVARHRNRV